MAAAAVRGAQGLGGREDGRRGTAENWRAGEGVGTRPEDVVAPRGSEVGRADRGDWHAVAESRAPPGDVGLAVWISEAAGRGRGADGVAGVVCAVDACGMSVGSSSGETLEGTVDRGPEALQFEAAYSRAVHVCVDLASAAILHLRV